MLVSQAQALLDMGKSADAFNLALQAIPLVPQRADADFLAGIAAYRQDLLDAAERQMRLALDRAPVDPSLPINRKLVSDAL
jgi:tetratricopeptide (TPR) repeat protein